MSHIGNEQHIDTGIRLHKSRESDHKQLQASHVSQNAVIHYDSDFAVLIARNHCPSAIASNLTPSALASLGINLRCRMRSEAPEDKSSAIMRNSE
jgi:hypothetical protein